MSPLSQPSNPFLIVSNRKALYRLVFMTAIKATSPNPPVQHVQFRNVSGNLIEARTVLILHDNVDKSALLQAADATCDCDCEGFAMLYIPRTSPYELAEMFGDSGLRVHDRIVHPPIRGLLFWRTDASTCNQE